MEINEDIKDIFKDHKATYKDLGEIQILDWKIDNTLRRSIRYIFDGNIMHISGDYGFATFWLTWKGTPQSFDGMNLRYFYEKLKAYEGDKTGFNSELAKEQIKEYFRERILEDYYSERQVIENEIECAEDDIKELDENDKDYENDLNAINEDIEYYNNELQELENDIDIQEKKNLMECLMLETEYIANADEWNNKINNECFNFLNIDKLKEYDEYYYEWIYGLGEDIPKRIELYLAGLNMASEQLKNKE